MSNNDSNQNPSEKQSLNSIKQLTPCERAFVDSMRDASDPYQPFTQTEVLDLVGIIDRLASANAAQQVAYEHLQAAYSTLMRENRCQVSDLNNWNFLSGMIFRERAEGVESEA